MISGTVAKPSRLRNVKTAKRNRARQPRSLDTLAAAYAEVGDFQKAVDTMRRAIKFAEERREFALKVDLEDRLQMYDDRLPYRMR